MRQDEERLDQLIPQLWAEKFLYLSSLNAEGWEQYTNRLGGRKWLEKSLKDDNAPDWLIELVLERWNQR